MTRWRIPRRLHKFAWRALVRGRLPAFGVPHGVAHGVAVAATRGALVFFIGAVLLGIDPFGFSATLDRVGRDAFYKVLAPSFDTEEVSATVVIIDDAFLAEQNSYWPMPYVAHGELLRAIGSFAPRAVFIDLAFVDPLPDPTLPSLVAALEEVAETTPVLLAAASPESGAATPIRAELAALAERNDAVTLVSVLYGRGLGSDRAYRMSPDSAGHPSAAVALYQAVCAKSPRGCAAIPETVDLDLVWPLPHPFNCLAPSRPCQGVSRQPLVRLFRHFVGGALGGAAPGFLVEPNPIEAAGMPTVSAEALSSGSYRALLNPLMEDRTIIYGANLALTGDSARSPVNGEVPGVLAHATAFTNLEVYGSRFVRAAPPLEMRTSVHLGLLLALAVMIGYGTELIAVRQGLTLNRRLQLQIAVHLGLAAVITGIEYGVLRSGPANWWGIFSAVAAARWVVGRLEIGGALSAK